MSENIVKKITVQKLGYTFEISVQEDGMILCSMEGKTIGVEALADGNIKFAEKQKVKVNGTLMGIGGLSLSGEEFSALKEAQEAQTAGSPQTEEKKQEALEPAASAVAEPEQALSATEETSVAESQPEDLVAGESSAGSDGESAAAEEYWQKLWEDRNDAIKSVDSWKRSVHGYREKEKKGQKYCIHTIRIGNNKYRFVERQIHGTGVVINPDYKILDDLPGVGGVPKQYGELLFWDYLFEGKGWERVRVLTHNEEICLNIIQKYGYFAIPKDKEKMLKSKKSLLKKPKKKEVKEKESGVAELPPAEDNK